MHEQEYEVERSPRRLLNALEMGMGLRSLIVCAFGELALPSVRAGLAFSGEADPPDNDVARFSPKPSRRLTRPLVHR